ncbi:MAG: OmpA family protein [Francisellaceae bacterium]|jgi:sodium-type flagellar protein MotY|nr:OmpA family protein [Francisellaceae bacterium]MBT6208148.1 OmpA family protein [Francisellaceae bacterium]MBT6539493.1 OmpA family protein [Francisellaceae bacterium]
MSRASIKTINVILLIILGLSGQAYASEYVLGASYEDSHWNVKSSIFECKMDHEITGYGKLVFSKLAGLPETADLDIWSLRSIPQLPAVISFISPPWMDDKRHTKGWTFYFGEHRRPVEFSPRDARKILDSLKVGMMPVISHRHNSDRTQGISVQISPVNFIEGYNQYTYCLGSLLPYSYEELRVTNILFDTASSRISNDMLKMLDHLINYAKDPDVHRLEISGYTDSVGSFRANHQLASYRVESVRDYLIQNGISEKIIRLKIHGEQGANSRNDSSHGRAKNRRVEVKMHR